MFSVYVTRVDALGNVQVAGNMYVCVCVFMCDTKTSYTYIYKRTVLLWHFNMCVCVCRLDANNKKSVPLSERRTLKLEQPAYTHDLNV